MAFERANVGILKLVVKYVARNTSQVVCVSTWEIEISHHKMGNYGVS